MDSMYYQKPNVIANNIVEAQYSDDDHLRKLKSMEVKMTMVTSDDRVSPVVDIQRTNMNVVRNLIDNPNEYSISTNEPSVGIIKWQDQLSEDESVDVGATLSFTDQNNIRRIVKVIESDGLGVSTIRLQKQ